LAAIDGILRKVTFYDGIENFSPFGHDAYCGGDAPTPNYYHTIGGGLCQATPFDYQDTSKVDFSRFVVPP
jgi:hypothetical protein